MNSARSALSAYGINFNHVPVGSNAIIIRFMKGVYNLRPSEPKYCKTWDFLWIVETKQTKLVTKLYRTFCISSR
jgi:hypothetical protein